MSRNKHHEWTSAHLESTVQYIDEHIDDVDSERKEMFALLAQTIDDELHDEPVEYLIDVLALDLHAAQEFRSVLLSARVDEVLDSPDPCAGHRDLADGTCSCYEEQTQ